MGLARTAVTSFREQCHRAPSICGLVTHPCYCLPVVACDYAGVMSQALGCFAAMAPTSAQLHTPPSAPADSYSVIYGTVLLSFIRLQVLKLCYGFPWPTCGLAMCFLCTRRMKASLAALGSAVRQWTQLGDAVVQFVYVLTDFSAASLSQGEQC